MESRKTFLRIATAAFLIAPIQAQSSPLHLLPGWLTSCASWIQRSQSPGAPIDSEFRAFIEGDFLVFPSGARLAIAKRLSWGRIIVKIPFTRVIRGQNSYIHQILAYYFEQSSVVKTGFRGDLTPDGNMMIDDGHHRIRVYHQKFSQNGEIPFLLEPERDGSFVTRSYQQALAHAGKFRDPALQGLSPEELKDFYQAHIDQILLDRASEAVLQKIYLDERHLPTEFQARRQRMRGIRPGVMMWDY